MKKSKVNRSGNQKQVNKYDQCMTPFYALPPLVKYLPQDAIIWESACGEGYIVYTLRYFGFDVFGSDLAAGGWPRRDFYEWQPQEYDVQVTNPPWSHKYAWLEKSISYQKPFALLVPVDTLGAKGFQIPAKNFGLQVIFMDKRIDYKMPNKGWNGAGSHFASVWVTWQLGLPDSMVFETVDKTPIEQLRMFDCLEK